MRHRYLSHGKMEKQLARQGKSIFIVHTHHTQLNVLYKDKAKNRVHYRHNTEDTPYDSQWLINGR